MIFGVKSTVQYNKRYAFFKNLKYAFSKSADSNSNAVAEIGHGTCVTLILTSFQNSSRKFLVLPDMFITALCLFQIYFFKFECIMIAWRRICVAK